MKLFKKHKTKDKATFNVGIRKCRTCENNLRCEECAYPRENEMLKAEIERLQKEMEGWRDTAYHEASQCETAKAEAIEELAERFNNIVDEELEKYSLKDFEEFKAICQVLRGLKIRCSYSVKEMVGEDK